MIFKDKIHEIDKLLRPEIDRLLDLAGTNQAHPSDLLLLHINGFYQNDILIHNKNSGDNFDPHVIGSGMEGYSESAHYSFIHKYRTTNIVKSTLKDYQQEHVWSPENREKIDALTEIEETTIQLEMMIYLKIWEADLFIKKLYQFTRILLGLNYDWYFKISESNRDSNSTGTRQDILRKLIRDKLQPISPIMYDLIKNTYKTQIRNSIAHSNYSFAGRRIHLNNYIQNDPASQMTSISFDEWIDIFHNTLMLHNEYIRLNKNINEKYAKIASHNGNCIDILVTEKDGNQYSLPVEYRDSWNDWKFKIK